MNLEGETWINRETEQTTEVKKIIQSAWLGNDNLISLTSISGQPNAPIINCCYDSNYEIVYAADQVTTLFTPTQLNDLNFWFDATDSSTITEINNSISHWDDKSVSQHALSQSNGAKQPTIGLVTIGGLKTITFNGSSDSLINYSINRNTLPVSMFVVLKTGVLSKVQYFNAATANVGYLSTNFSNNIRIASGGEIITGSVISANTDYIIGGDWNNTNSELWLNATSNATGTISLGAGFGFTLGSFRTGSGLYSDASWGEIICFNAILSETNRQKVEGYLAHKWNLLDNLPINHPYKTTKPKSV